jgi:hypothetical protein
MSISIIQNSINFPNLIWLNSQDEACEHFKHFMTNLKSFWSSKHIISHSAAKWKFLLINCRIKSCSLCVNIFAINFGNQTIKIVGNWKEFFFAFFVQLTNDMSVRMIFEPLLYNEFVKWKSAGWLIIFQLENSNFDVWKHFCDFQVPNVKFPEISNNKVDGFLDHLNLMHYKKSSVFMAKMEKLNEKSFAI